jgi:hypothetical protein
LAEDDLLGNGGLDESSGKSGGILGSDERDVKESVQYFSGIPSVRLLKNVEIEESRAFTAQKGAAVRFGSSEKYLDIIPHILMLVEFFRTNRIHRVCPIELHEHSAYGFLCRGCFEKDCRF